VTIGLPEGIDYHPITAFVRALPKEPAIHFAFSLSDRIRGTRRRCEIPSIKLDCAIALKYGFMIFIVVSATKPHRLREDTSQRVTRISCLFLHNASIQWKHFLKTMINNQA
jgi:hypothetical protein